MEMFTSNEFKSYCIMISVTIKNMLRFIKENWFLLLCLAYIISPIDFIPEALVGPIGLIDDLGVVLLLLIVAIVKHYRDEKYMKTLQRINSEK